MVDVDSAAPGLYRHDVLQTPAPVLPTGVPLFVGHARDGPYEPQQLTLWPQFEARFGPALDDGYLAAAVRGFFENDGLTCLVLRLGDTGSVLRDLDRGLAALDDRSDFDLLCAPDLMRTGSPVAQPDPVAVATAQRRVLEHCQEHPRCFAVLDAVPGAVDMQLVSLPRSDAGALYHPWVMVPTPGGAPRPVPPCGHVAGIYSRTDHAAGTHKAPANEELEGVVDLGAHLGEPEVVAQYAQGVNCLRALPGRGIRVWGARTLSPHPAWRYVNVRRVFLSLGRWVERFMTGLVHEPNDIRLWVRIMRDLTVYLDGLFQQGALKGRTPQEAFYVRCDSQTNPPEVIRQGVVVTEVGIAVAAPAEFVVARLIHGASGVSITTEP